MAWHGREASWPRGDVVQTMVRVNQFGSEEVKKFTRCKLFFCDAEETFPQIRRSSTQAQACHKRVVKGKKENSKQTAVPIDPSLKGKRSSGPLTTLIHENIQNMGELLSFGIEPVIRYSTQKLKAKPTLAIYLVSG